MTSALALATIAVLGAAEKVERVTLVAAVTSEGVAVPDVLVTVASGSLALSDRTDRHGIATFSDLAPGRYGVAFESDDHRRLEYPNYLLESASKTVTLNAQLYPPYRGPTGLVPVCEAANAPELENAKYLRENCARAWTEPFWIRQADTDEPSLLARAADRSAEAYRLIWSRTFNKPAIVRFEVPLGGSPFAETKVFGGKGGYGWGRILLTEKRFLERSDLEALREHYQRVRFWDLPREVVEISRDGGVTMCLDGTSWYFEGLSEGRYHAIARSCPGPQVELRALGELMLHLSGVDFERYTPQR